MNMSKSHCIVFSMKRLVKNSLWLAGFVFTLSSCHERGEPPSKARQMSRAERFGSAPKKSETRPETKSDPRIEWVEVQVDPPQKHDYAVMRVGVRQHVDRRYTYDVVPHELEGGLLYQGMHRPPRNTRVRIVLKRAARVYFFFHHRFDGGYTKIFSRLPNWIRQPNAPQYDLKGGDHGRSMIMYAADLQPGSFELPATTRRRACFSIVFQF